MSKANTPDWGARQMNPMLRDIAARVKQDYRDGRFETIPGGEVRFTIDNLRITCVDSGEAVLAVAAKYAKGVKCIRR